MRQFIEPDTGEIFYEEQILRRQDEIVKVFRPAGRSAKFVKIKASQKAKRRLRKLSLAEAGFLFGVISMDIKSGIYKITCSISGKVYIGSSLDCEKRFHQHVNQLRKGKHHNSYLQRAWDKYGKNHFKFEVIERVGEKQKLIEREQYWIDTTKCYDPDIGYNLCAKAGTPAGSRPAKEVMMSTTENAKRIWESLTLNEAGLLAFFIVYLDAKTNSVYGDSEIGENGKPLSLTSIAKRTGMSIGTIYKLIKGLEKKQAIVSLEVDRRKVVYVNPQIAVANVNIGDSLNHLFDYDLSIYEKAV